MEIPWIDIASVFLSPIITIILFFLGYRWAHKYWLKEKKKEINYGVEHVRFERKLVACKAVWALLAYMSEKENTKTIFVAREENNQKIWKLRKIPAEEFLDELPKVFFDLGHGIFMPHSVRDDIYDFRSRVFRFLEKANREGNIENEILVNNQELISRIIKLREKLAATLKEEVLKNP